MHNREKVIKELETEIQDFSPACTSDERLKETMEMTLELLKGQEPAPPIPYQQETSIGFFAGFKCGVCNAVVFPDYRFCPICGKAVKWDA